MKTETLFERPRIEGTGDAIKQTLRNFGARARDAGLATLGSNKAQGRLSIRIITNKLIKGFMTYVGAHDIHPITDDTVRDYISHYYGEQLEAVEPTIRQITGEPPDQPDDEFDQYTQGTGQQSPPDETDFDQFTQGTGQPPAPTAQPQPAQGTQPAQTGQTGNANIARQSTPDEMGRFQKLQGAIMRSVMNPTPDPQFMNKIGAFLRIASGSGNLRQFAKQKIDELKARPDVVQRYPEIANIGDDPFLNLPRQPQGTAPAPVTPAAQPQGGAQPTFLNREWLMKAGNPSGKEFGYDMTIGGKALAGQARDALAKGYKVQLIVDNGRKTVDITGINNQGMMTDAEGQPWGSFSIMGTNEGLRITPQTAPAASNPAAPTQPPVANATPNAQPNLTTAFQDAGAALGNNMYNMFWNKVTHGDVTEGGRPSAMLQAAKQQYDGGAIKSRDEFINWAQNWTRQQMAARQQAKPAAPVTPVATSTPATNPAPAQPTAPVQPAALTPTQRYAQQQAQRNLQARMQSSGRLLNQTAALKRQYPRRAVEGQEWWVMAAVDNALQATQRGAPQRQEVIAALRSLQNNPQAVAKIPQLKQIPMEHHRRVFDLATFLVENQVADKTALHAAYRRIMLEAVALNRGQIDQIFMVLARKLSLSGQATTEPRWGKKTGQTSGQDTGYNSQRPITGETLITADALQRAAKRELINPNDLKRLLQVVGKDGAKIKAINIALRHHNLTDEMKRVLTLAARNSGH